MKVFRKKFITNNCIGLAPKSGYRSKTNQSKIAFMWLEQQNEIYGGNIQFSGYPKEIVLPDLKMSVDGYLEKDGKKIVFEFWGCFWHGHTCYKNR